MNSPRAAALMHHLVARMGHQNAVVVSHKTLAKMMGCGTRTIILTVLIAGIGAALFPIREPQGQDGSQEGDDRHAA